MPEILPVFCDNVKIVPWRAQGKPVDYFIENPRNGEVLQLDETGYFLTQQLDGATDATTILRRYEDRFGISLSPEDLSAFVRQLAQRGLLTGTFLKPPSRTFTDFFLFENLMPMPVFPFGGGDRLFGWLAWRLRWLFAWPVHLLGAGAISLAGILVLQTWLYGNLGVSLQGLEFVVLMIVFSWSVVPSARTIAHSLTSKHVGVQVPMLGVCFFWRLFPSFYCELSDLPWHSKKSHCQWIIFSGIYIQILLWAVGTITWWLTTPGSYANTAWLSLAFGAGISLVVVTANPLVDMSNGSLLLANWLEIPRLMGRAMAATGSWLLGRPWPESLTRRERYWFVAYGLLALTYNAIIWFLFLYIVAAQLIPAFQGAGAVVTAGIMAFMLQRPLGRFAAGLRPIRWFFAWDRSARRWIWRLGLLLLIVLVLLLPYPYETGGPVTILPNVQTEVHCEIDGGRIEGVFVREGDLVTKDQPLGQINRREYDKNVQATQAQLDNAGAKLQLLRKQLALLDQPPDIEQIQSLEAEVRRLQTSLTDYRRQLELTTLRAPITGRVTTKLIDQKVGQYLKTGDLFATVEQVQAVQAEIQVPEGDVPQVRIGARVKVVPWAYPHETFYGSVREIAPIAAMPATPTSAVTVNSVRVIAEIPNQDMRLKGQLTGYAKIETTLIPMWRVLSRLLIRWFQVQFWYWLP